MQVPNKNDPIDAPMTLETVPKVKMRKHRTRGRKAKNKEFESPASQAKSTAMCHFIWRIKQKRVIQYDMPRWEGSVDSSRNAFKPP